MGFSRNGGTNVPTFRAVRKCGCMELDLDENARKN